MIVRSIKEQFDQPEYRVPVFREFNYGSDFDENNLRTQLQTVAANIKGSVTNIFNVRSYLNGLTSAELVLLSEVVKLMKLVLVMPATNASSEITFSAMSYLGSPTGGQPCLRRGRIT